MKIFQIQYKEKKCPKTWKYFPLNVFEYSIRCWIACNSTRSVYKFDEISSYVEISCFISAKLLDKWFVDEELKPKLNGRRKMFNLLLIELNDDENVVRSESSRSIWATSFFFLATISITCFKRLWASLMSFSVTGWKSKSKKNKIVNRNVLFSLPW